MVDAADDCGRSARCGHHCGGTEFRARTVYLRFILKTRWPRTIRSVEQYLGKTESNLEGVDPHRAYHWEFSSARPADHTLRCAGAPLWRDCAFIRRSPTHQETPRKLARRDGRSLRHAVGTETMNS